MDAEAVARVFDLVALRLEVELDAALLELLGELLGRVVVLEGMSFGSISTIVTSLPNLASAEANSQPMMPPPRMTMRRGTSV